MLRLTLTHSQGGVTYTAISLIMLHMIAPSLLSPEGVTVSIMLRKLKLSQVSQPVTNPGQKNKETATVESN